MAAENLNSAYLVQLILGLIVVLFCIVALAWLAKLREMITPQPAELDPIEEESPILVLWSRKLDGADYRRIRREAAEHIIALTR